MKVEMISKEEIRAIVDLLFDELSARCRAQMNISLKVRPSARDLIAKSGFDPKYGARPLRRAMKTKVEDLLAEELLAGKIREGDTVTASEKNGSITFAVKKAQR